MIGSLDSRGWGGGGGGGGVCGGGGGGGGGRESEEGIRNPERLVPLPTPQFPHL